MTRAEAVDTAVPSGVDARLLYRGIFFVALATLLYEITLIRVLSFTIWYHFGYVVISTALLGYGAAGTLLAIRPSIGRADLRRSLTLYTLLAAASAAAFLLLIFLLPLHPMQILRQPGQALLFLVYQLGASVPFFFSGLAICLALRLAADRVDRLYGWDLLGGSLGCALAVGLMNAFTPPGAAIFAAAVFALAAAIFAGRAGARLGALALAALLLLAVPFGGRIPFETAASKHLSLHIQLQGMVPVFSEWSALFRTDVVEKLDGVGPPFSKADEWGLSRRGPEQIQSPRYFVTHDGSAGTPIFDLRKGELDFLDDHILRFPYLISPPHPDVLVIGVGGGRDVVTALRYQARHVTGVELDPITIRLLREHFDESQNGLFRRPEVELVAGEGRHFVRRAQKRFDLIQLTGVDTLTAEFTGAHVLAENYLYTVEAYHDYFEALSPGGIVSITTGHTEDANPRAAGRMVSVARRALLERGAARPEQHIVVIDSGRLFANVLVSPAPFTRAQLAALREKAVELGFKILLMPGQKGHPVFEGLALLDGAERERLLDGLAYLVDAVTDDSPFFFKAFRWSELFLPGPVPISPIHETALGQIVLLLLLLSLSLLGLVLVLGPLLAFRRRGIAGGGARKYGILFYFLAIGLGFMLFEISLMQRFVLYLGYPTYSLSVTLFTLLSFLGLGSILSRRWIGRDRIVLPVSVALIALLALFYMEGLPLVQQATLGSGLAVRVLLSALMLAPLGLVLGTFFPLGVRRAAEVHEDLVPWAWGINGCASVTGTVLTVVLAMNTGFRFVWLLSLVIYAAGVAVLLATTPRATALGRRPR